MKQIALLLSIVILGISSRAQGIYNNGARIVSESGTSLRLGSCLHEPKHYYILFPPWFVAHETVSF